MNYHKGTLYKVLQRYSVQEILVHFSILVKDVQCSDHFYLKNYFLTESFLIVIIPEFFSKSKYIIYLLYLKIYIIFFYKPF